MQAYNAGFARIYNLRWGGFAQHVAPRIAGYYASTPLGQRERTLLDLCCGTGQLAAHFLAAGFRVVGLDASEAMLHYARENNATYVPNGQARFVPGDARRFQLDERFGLVVSTFDALNHLEDEEALQECFRSVYDVVLVGGCFIFDLNTPFGLRQWDGINVDDSSDGLLLITRGLFDQERGRAWTKITGYLRGDDGRHERFDQVAFNTAFDLARVRALLLQIGWRQVHLAQVEDLATPLAEPELARRVFFVAHK